jgi:hypothetical protein
MVNLYGDDVPPNPNEDPTPPPTIEAADLGNKIGWENRAAIGSNTLYGQSPQALQTIVEQQNQQRALQEQQRRDQQLYYEQIRQEQARRQVVQMTYAEQARLDAAPRPRYTDLKDLGDSTTQAIFSNNKLMRMMGFNFPDDETVMGRTLEAQRIAALQTPGTQDERFYENERDKWNANSIELSSAYGNVGRKEGIPIPANPFENRGDVALALEKGGNAKDFTPATYGFNPNVGSMLGLLPGGKGFQESEWDTAVARDKGRAAPAPVSFMDAINYQAAQQGRMGVYGNLFGGVKDTAPNVPVRSGGQVMTSRMTGMDGFGIFGERTAKRPFLSVSSGDTVKTETIAPTGEIDFFGLKATVPFLARFQQPTIKTTITGKPRESGTLFSQMAGGDNFFFKMGTSPEKMESSPWVSSKGKVAVGAPILGDIFAVGAPIISTRFNPATGMTDTISEQKYQQEATQKYETWDMSKQMVIPTMITYRTGEQPTKEAEPVRALSFGGTISDFTTAFGKLKQGDILGGVGMYSQGISRFTTRAVMPDATGVGKSVENWVTTNSQKTPFGYISTPVGTVKTPLGTILAGVGHGGEAVYTNIRNDPVQDVALYMLPFAFKFAEVGIANTVARVSTSGSKVLSTGGRALSTPAAKTSASLFKVGLGALYVGQSGMNIYNAPSTPEGKGKAVGDVVYQVGMMGAGLSLAAGYTPTMRENPFDSRTFFSGERKLPASERAMIWAGDVANRITMTKGQRVAIKSVSTEYGKNLFTKPEITTTEPNLADLTHVGKGNAAKIKFAMMEQPSVGYGSGMMDAQIGKTPMGAILRKTALPSADVDVFAEFPTRMKTIAGKKAALGMDIHEFPEGYPNVGQTTNAPVEAGSYLFGNRYRSNPFIDEITMPGKTPGYKGDIAFEHLNVQFRKLSSAVRDDVADPMNKGYRLGKDVSRLTRVRDVLEETRVGRNPTTSGTSAYDEMLKQVITYNEQSSKGGTPNIRTDTLGNIRARYENTPVKQKTPTLFSPYSKGALSTWASVVAAGSITSSVSTKSSLSSQVLSSKSSSASKSASKQFSSLLAYGSKSSIIPSVRTPVSYGFGQSLPSMLSISSVARSLSGNSIKSISSSRRLSPRSASFGISSSLKSELSSFGSYKSSASSYVGYSTSIVPSPLPFFGGSGSSDGRGRKFGKIPWREIIPLKNVLLTGKPLIKMPKAPRPAPRPAKKAGKKNRGWMLW